jgi:hypothetical protein
VTLAVGPKALAPHTEDCSIALAPNVIRHCEWSNPETWERVWIALASLLTMTMRVRMHSQKVGVEFV